ncbi:hypothetical protein G6F24_017068 [Rhizopus arrhizus]|nr:hypothetical protein G6F24_017068 [Rhizopus arrhizus]
MRRPPAGRRGADLRGEPLAAERLQRGHRRAAVRRDPCLDPGVQDRLQPGRGRHRRGADPADHPGQRACPDRRLERHRQARQPVRGRLPDPGRRHRGRC